MKTLGRILVILTAFAVVMGITYFAVNAGGTSTNAAPQFENGERQLQPGQLLPGGEFDGRREGGRERGGSIFGLGFGLTKNTVIIAIVVALIAVPGSMARNRKRTIPVAAAE